MSDKQAVATLLLLIEEFRKLNPDLPVQHLAAFLQIAKEEGIILQDVMQRTGMSQPATSRAVTVLAAGEFVDRGATRQGLGLIEAFDNPFNRRSKVVKLSPRGKQLILRLQRILGKRA